MSYFIQPKEYDMNIHAKIQRIIMHDFFVSNYFDVWIMKILYKAIMHKKEFGQAYCNHLLKMILKKFNSYFSKFYFTSYVF
jgi:hypothetical protein